MPTAHEVFKDKVERKIAERAAAACNKKFGELFEFRVDGRKYTDGRYVITHTSKKSLQGIDHALMNTAIWNFIEGFRVSADHWEW